MTTRALLLTFAATFLLHGCAQSEPASSESAPSTASTNQLAPLLDPNSVDATALGAVPGLSGDAIQAIIGKRPFSTPTQLHDAIKDSVAADDLEKIYSAMFVKVDLNNASDADMRLIPNSLRPGKLAHEFEEYRPYADMDQFRREIGKYVDAAELARLERYVVIKP